MSRLLSAGRCAGTRLQLSARLKHFAVHHLNRNPLGRCAIRGRAGCEQGNRSPREESGLAVWFLQPDERQAGEQWGSGPGAGPCRALASTETLAWTGARCWDGLAAGLLGRGWVWHGGQGAPGAQPAGGGLCPGRRGVHVGPVTSGQLTHRPRQGTRTAPREGRAEHLRRERRARF